MFLIQEKIISMCKELVLCEKFSKLKSFYSFYSSFMCGEGSVFDQDRMTCISQFEALPCEQASTYYFRNEEFGLPQEQKF